MTNDDCAAIELRAMASAWRTLEKRWDLSSAERKALLPDGGEDADDPPRSTETRMRILIEIGYRIGLPGGDLHDWLRTPTPTLGWLAPLDVMSGGLGDLRWVRALIEQGLAS